VNVPLDPSAFAALTTVGVSVVYGLFAYAMVLHATARPGATGGTGDGGTGGGGVSHTKPDDPPASTGDQRFATCVALVLKYEGGNDDDPRDPGGRTSRGILQREWNVWRQTHPGLPSDVWDAPQDQVIAIYRQSYWDALSCSDLAPGVDLCTFDFGVNSGNSRSAKLLQQLVGSEVDGEVGPNTTAATAKVTDTAGLINKFCDARLKFLQGLGTWGTFGKGWTNRVEDVRKQALAMAAGAPATPAPAPPTSAPWLDTMKSLDGLHWDSGEGKNPKIAEMLEFIATTFPDMAAYCRDEEKLDYFAWCGLTVAYCMAKAGIRPPYQLGVDTSSFLWAKSWADWGVAVTTPQPGDVLVYDWGHVSLYDHETAGDQYASHGGNQSHTVNVMMFPMANCVAIRRPA